MIRSSLEVDSTVVPLGVDHDRFFPAQEPGHGIVCVADFYPHKRHDLLIRAWAQLPAPRPPLALVGDPPLNADCYEEVSVSPPRSPTAGTISIEPDLSQDEVADRYRSASVFALASEMESFNLPVVEAQACGLATVVREMPVLRETGGPSTIFVEGSEVDAWAGALERAAGQGAEARELGIEHAAGFTWAGAATQVHDAIVAGELDGGRLEVRGGVGGHPHVRHRPALLARTLASVLAQRDVRIEVIVVHDGPDSGGLRAARSMATTGSSRSPPSGPPA